MNTIQNSEDFFDSLTSIPDFKPSTSIKSNSVVNVEFNGTSVDIILDSQIMIVTGVHAEITLSIGRRLKVPFSYWSRERSQTVLAFGKQPTNFVDKTKLIIMMHAVFPLTLLPEAFNDKKVIVYKNYDDTELSLYLTNDICIFVNETKNNRPIITELDGEIMEDKLKDPESAEKTIDDLTEASSEHSDKHEPKAIYGDAVEAEN